MGEVCRPEVSRTVMMPVCFCVIFVICVIYSISILTFFWFLRCLFPNRTTSMHFAIRAVIYYFTFTFSFIFIWSKLNWPPFHLSGIFACKQNEIFGGGENERQSSEILNDMALIALITCAMLAMHFKKNYSLSLSKEMSLYYNSSTHYSMEICSLYTPPCVIICILLWKS